MMCYCCNKFIALRMRFLIPGWWNLKPKEELAWAHRHLEQELQFLYVIPPIFLRENIHQYTPDAGYAVALDISKKQCFYRIISVYFPSHIPTSLEPLIDWLSFMFNTKRHVIMGEDYNCVLNISLDSKNRTIRQKIALRLSKHYVNMAILLIHIENYILNWRNTQIKDR